MLPAVVNGDGVTDEGGEDGGRSGPGLQNLLVTGLVPVSYTHLDVYKRQGDDVGKQDHGDTVADTEFRDLLAQPHDQSGLSFSTRKPCSQAISVSP